jgi:ABC-type multidrug transport system fused ATPase/permease subunit
VVIAAHRLSSVRAADQILVLAAGGRPAELGTHAALVAAGGWYARTWAQQQTRAELEEL